MKRLIILLAILSSCTTYNVTVIEVKPCKKVIKHEVIKKKSNESITNRFQLYMNELDSLDNIN